MKKTIVMIATMIACVALNAVNAAPLPEAKPDDVGFSQQGLARLDDFFTREIAAKRVPGAVVAIARDGKLVHYKAYGELSDAHGARPTASSGGACGLFSGLRRYEGGHPAG